MKQLAEKLEIVKQLQKEILSMQGFCPPVASGHVAGHLGSMEAAFPNAIFPRGAIHELASTTPEAAAATSGFIAGLLTQLIGTNGLCLWIGNCRAIFPPALKMFGIHPHQVVFIDVVREKDVLWTIEEALKCKALSVVVGECKDLSLTESRRLQLATEQSHATALLHRYSPRSNNPIASVAKWKITPLASVQEDGMPGVGFPRWNVSLLKVRNGVPRTWQVEWNGTQFSYLEEAPTTVFTGHLVKTG